MVSIRMRSIYIFTILGISMIFSKHAFAQYDNIRFPQTADEIALFRDHKVMGETQWSIENGKKIPYYSRAFDPGGHVVISADYYHRQYYIYDANGNVVSFLDSSRNEKGTFEAKEYKFRYFDNGKLMEAEGPGLQSLYQFVPETNVLTEKLVKNDTAYTNRYKYDPQGRLTDALYLDASNKPMIHLTKYYSSDGRIFNETISSAGKEFSDSTLTVYEYNDNKQLISKHRFRFQVYYFDLKGTGKPDHSASHYDDAVSNFDLDEKGRPVAEEFTIKGDKLNYRYSTWKYDNNGLVTKETYRIGKAEPKTIVHEYVYFDQ
jgi:hypothetical protein